MGFARVAVKHGCTIIPVINVGTEDMVDVRGEEGEERERGEEGGEGRGRKGRERRERKEKLRWKLIWQKRKGERR